ncbi:MAG: hypothetical protein Q9174_001735 [Haloplaca sp. 1 TL-2023]
MSEERLQVLKHGGNTPGSRTAVRFYTLRDFGLTGALRLGRSVSQCQKAYESLLSRMYQIPPQPLGPILQPSPSSALSRKRPTVGGDSSMGPNRELQPRTPVFSTVNDPVESPAYPPGLTDSGDQRKKKRGRPSKAEAEVKAAEYAARGEPYPPPRKSKQSKTSAEGPTTMASTVTFTPVTMGPSIVEGPSAGRKRTPKTKAVKEDTISGYGATPTNPQMTQGALGQPNPTPAPWVQGSPREVAETAVAHSHPPAQTETRERHELGPDQRALYAQVTSSEANPSPERPDANKQPGANADTPHMNETAYSPLAARQDVPDPVHGPQTA